ncbi:MAG: ATP-binding protein [Bacteroidota bacterium]
MIHRIVEQKITDRLFQGKVILLVGPRQVGKTTLVKTIAQKSGLRYLYLNADEPDVPMLFEGKSSSELLASIGPYQMLILDEAQRIDEIGLVLKRLIDAAPGIPILVTGSSALDLADTMNEPLTGRKFDFNLFPISYPEIQAQEGVLEATRSLERRLIYGSYPEIINHPGDETIRLNTLVSSYLYKDILALAKIRRPSLLQKLVQALALQVGSEVSNNELSRLIGSDNQTVEKYIDLLEKAFVVFRLPAFSRNVRIELKKSKKVFFYDNGVRNAVIANFKPLEIRDDKGALWENYLISERIKWKAYQGIFGNSYFWRTTQKQEIDYLEERDGQLFVYEMTWKSNHKKRIPLTFQKAYPNATAKVIHRANFTDLFD